MHVRVRVIGKPEEIVVVESKLTKVEAFRRLIRDKFNVNPKLQRLLYGGKLLEDGYTFHDYGIKLNDVIQLMVRTIPIEEASVIQTEKENVEEKKDAADTMVYEDAESKVYVIGDLIDMKDREQGAWFEGKVVRIVQDPSYIPLKEDAEKDGPSDKENDCDNKAQPKKKGIAEYFSKIEKLTKKKQLVKREEEEKRLECGLLYKVHLDADSEDGEDTHYCKFKEIRPRARREIDIKDLKLGETVMVNYNSQDSHEKGYWYDFKIDEIKKLRVNYELIGTLYLGPDAVPQNDTKVKLHDKIFAVEEAILLENRTEEYKKLMTTETEKRSLPLNCMTCRDDEDAQCKDCGCYQCSGKEEPEKIVLCDECNRGYHMHCMSPPMSSLPADDEDWYCPACKRDTNSVVAPGAAKQLKKASLSKTTRDWGRGMACVGKTKSCSMPPNHFGPIPGIEVGMCWRFRIQLSESGVHRPPVSGIHGRDVEGAYSIVLSGGYEDDFDNGDEFTYTGSGGRDLSGNKRTAEQSCDQTLTRENKALARNCAVKEVSEQGGDAGERWREGRPVRVVRSYKMVKHFPEYAPKEGIRYDGIYKVVKYYPEKGKSGFRVWKYMLRRHDPAPAPWEAGAKQYEIVYPDGYLEAEAQKKALKGAKGAKPKPKKKRILDSSSEGEEASSPPQKKRKQERASPETKKRGRPTKNDSKTESPKGKITTLFSPKQTKQLKQETEKGISQEEQDLIKADELNAKLWEECLDICKREGKKEFVEHVTKVFLCIICQEVAASPVTTSCLHNFCEGCMKLAFKKTGSRACPHCRRDLSREEPTPNAALRAALRGVMPGYDAGKQ